jgi:protein-disulfide isomerase
LVNKKYVILPAVGIAIVAVVVGISLSTSGEPDRMASSTEMQKTETQANSALDMFSGGSPMLGSPDAPVTMVEFGDYQCQNCNRYFRNTEHMILQNYVETGKLKIIFVDFAFIGPDSLPAAQAAHCANDQGKYWEYHDETYSNWDGENTGWAGIYNLKRFASNIGLDQNSFNQCLDGNKYAKQVEANTELGHKIGVTGTPTFFIIDSEGEAVKIVGAQPYSSFAKVLDSKL